MTVTAEDPGPPAAGRRRSGDPVLVLNSGSSSVKFALLRPATGERLLGGIGEQLGTPEAVLRVPRFPGDAVEEKLPGGTHQAMLARVLDRVHEAEAAGGRLVGAGHRVVHGGERFTRVGPGGRLRDRRGALARSPGAAAQPRGTRCAATGSTASATASSAAGPPPGSAGPPVNCGIGENSALVRSLVLARLGFLGLVEDAEANASHGRRTGGRISVAGRVLALVVPTDEELLIARDTARVIAGG
jgi:acetate kinase